MIYRVQRPPRYGFKFKEGTHYTKTKLEALNHVNAILKRFKSSDLDGSYRLEITIEEIEITKKPLKELIVRCLNQDRFISSEKTIITVPIDG